MDDLTSRPDAVAVLQAQGLAARRGTETLFQGLDCTLQPGQVLWLRGANGSGKTTLLRVVAGLLQPDAGSLSWGGVPLTQSPQYPRGLVYIGHTQGLKDDLTALEALTFLVRLHGRDCTPVQAQDALRRLDMHHRRHLPVRTLSQGQKKRVALARLAMEAEASLWVLDEPLDALDDRGIACVQALLAEHVARGGSILMTSHIPLTLAGVSVQELLLDTLAPRKRQPRMAA